MILDDADQSMHTLRDEIRVLDLYLQLESLRFGQTFSYNIYADEALSPEEMQIPALLVQPLIENAVWHGLLHKNGARRLDVHFKKNGKNTLLCVVEDNGIGFGQALAMKDQRMNGEMQRPRGLQLVSDRLRMLENEYHVTCYCSVGEQHDEHGKITGTKATLQFPFLYED
jgi:LytS/YehU family sensor histidine kinase